jgi:hypothetical protein
MSTEVKMVYADVEEQLSAMNHAVTSLNPKAEPPITGNTMDVVTKLTELSTQLEQLLTNYQTVLIKNIETANCSVDFMRESDEKISSAIQGAAPSAQKAMP